MGAFTGSFLDINDLKFTKDRQVERCEEYKSAWLKEQIHFNKQAQVEVCSSFSKAVKYLEDDGEFNVLVTGSIHLVGVAMSIIDPTLGGILED